MSTSFEGRAPTTLLLINESPPPDPQGMSSVYEMFRRAGVPAWGMEDLARIGVGYTTVLRHPKERSAVPREAIEAEADRLAEEIGVLPDLRAVLLCGDVARTAFNLYAKRHSGRNAIPSGATYRIRGDAFHFSGWRVFPSYIVTGDNLKIEKGKIDMIVEDIGRACDVAGIARGDAAP